jgi:hypothetical protein
MEPWELEVIGLDAERVAAVAGATEDYAWLLRRGDIEQLELDATADKSDQAQEALSIATAFTTAASLWMLLTPDRAIPLLEEAAAQHDAAGSTQADVLRICAHASDASVDSAFAEEARAARPPEVTVLALLAPMATGHLLPSETESALSNLPEVSERPRATPTGKLRLPLGLYLDVLFEVASIRSERVDQGLFRASATEAYLSRVAEVMSLAQADRHHWEMPGIGLLPVEPEAVAPCALVDVAAREVLGQRVDELMNGSSLAMAVARVAHDLVDASGLDEPMRPVATA